MRIMTCNIRTSNAWDEENNWEHRKNICCDFIRSHNPDVFGCQEVSRIQYDDMDAVFPEYQAFAIDDHSEHNYPTNAIWYRRDAFECLDQGGYFLSETPEQAGSRSWDSAGIRLANWVELKEIANGSITRITNTHFDHKSDLARIHQARVCCEHLSDQAQHVSQILMGDFNVLPDHQVISEIEEHGFNDLCKTLLGEKHLLSSFHAFEKQPADAEGRIDYIFMRGPAQAQQVQILQKYPDDRFYSDHHFVLADITTND
ncbi:MAG: endonuclease/exonuclease/phosphatase family protein [Planctomycetes bacterium]|nr:endonuclease/exonuclease/phosphatase family protein [Planctomycetota bacterium]